MDQLLIVFILHFYVMLNHKHCFLLWLHYVYQSMIIFFRQFTFTLEREKATHSSLLAWRIPWTVLSMGSQRVGHDWETFTFLYFFGIIDNMMMTMLLLNRSVSRVWLFAIPGTLAHKSPLSVGFSRQEYWSGMSFPSPRDLPNPGIKTPSPAWASGLLPFFFFFYRWSTRCIQIS